MMILLTILKIMLWILLAALLLVLLVLVAPIGYQAMGRAGPEVRRGEGQVSLFWGLIRLKAATDDFKRVQATLTVAGISKKLSIKDKSQDFSLKHQAGKWAKKERAAPKETTEKPSKEKSSKKPSEKPSLSFTQVLEHLRSTINRDLVTVIRRFLRRIWNALRPQVFHIKVIYGLSDPYETAMVNNVFMALFAVWPHQALHLQPVFHDSLVDVTGNVKGSLIPMAFLAAALQLALSKQMRRIWWPLVKQHLKPSPSSTRKAPRTSTGAS